MPRAILAPLLLLILAFAAACGVVTPDTSPPTYGRISGGGGA